MAIDGYSANSAKGSDRALDQSLVSDVGQTRKTEDTSARKAGDDISGTSASYNKAADGDIQVRIETKIDEVIEKIDQVLALLDTFIVSFAGESGEAPAPLDAGAKPAPDPAANDTVETPPAPDLPTGGALPDPETNAAGGSKASFQTVADEIGNLLAQLQALLPSDAAVEPPEHESGDSTSEPVQPTQDPQETDTAPGATEDQANVADPSSSGDSDLLQALEGLSDLLDGLTGLQVGDSDDTTVPQASNGTIQNQGAGTGAQSEDDIKAAMDGLSGSLEQIMELLGSGDQSDGVKADGGTPASASLEASDSASNAGATASAGVNVSITISRGANGEILVTTAPADEPAKSEPEAGADSGGATDAGSSADADIPIGVDRVPWSRGGISPGNFGGFKSPLVLDADKDGAVEATAGMGVDIDGDGTADGAATGGDKMLAMGDITGDGQIGGAEVFGNKTVDPFTGEAMNAENGFEALQMVAASAEAHTGIQCIDNKGVVNLAGLDKALESLGAGLGLISGDNTTILESIGDAATIDTNDYVNRQDTGDVRHNQLGSYTDDEGKAYQVHDVWF